MDRPFVIPTEAEGSYGTLVEPVIKMTFFHYL